MNRREILAALAKGVGVAAALPEAALAAGVPAPAAASCGPAGDFPNVVVSTHEGRKALFYDDLLRGKTAMINFMSIAGEAANPVTASLAEVQRRLGDRLGRDVFMISITLDPERDTARALRQLAERHGAGPGWLFLTGEPAAIRAIYERFFDHRAHHAHHGGAGPVEDCALGMVRYGNAAAGLWGSAPARSNPAWLAARLEWVASPSAAARPASGPPRRRGPAPLGGALARLALLALPALLTALALMSPAGLAAAASSAVAPAAPAAAPEAPANAAAANPYPYLHPHPQPLPKFSTVTTNPAGDTTVVVSGDSIFPPSEPFNDPPGTNFLPTIYSNLYDSLGREVLNTLPSTPTIPYNLHDGDPVVTPISPISPRDDLMRIFNMINIFANATVHPPEDPVTKPLVVRAIAMGIDVLEGNKIDGRSYSGFPVLHYDEPEKLKTVKPIYDDTGLKIGGEVHIHQLWYDSHIESDTCLLDVSAVQDVPWTIVYTVDVLNRGEDDFSPYVTYRDVVQMNGMLLPLAGMDMTFFPMRDGTRTVFRIKMAPGKYFNLVYTWGWRMHPPRAQAVENLISATGKNLLVWETKVFGTAPRSSEEAKQHAIAQIGDLAPSKRMWTALRQARDALARDDVEGLKAAGKEGHLAFGDWLDRTRLPSGVRIDQDADMTLLYADGTLYGELTDGRKVFSRWQKRGERLKVTIYNADYYVHGYALVDFGGARGWENQFKSSVKVGGSGCWFTFGRGYWWPVIRPTDNVTVPVASRPTSATPSTPGVHKVDITFNFDPSRRLRLYQFDPMHHDVDIFSVH